MTNSGLLASLKSDEMTEDFQLSIPSELKYIKEVSSKILNALKPYKLDNSKIFDIKLCAEEAIRNAIDHGIEPPDERARKGKNKRGIVTLSACREGSHVVIEVSDDGAGIAVDKVRLKAIERGLITAERAAQLPERELLQLVFLPGFSTAAAVAVGIAATDAGAAADAATTTGAAPGEAGCASGSRPDAAAGGTATAVGRRSSRQGPPPGFSWA